MTLMLERPETVEQEFITRYQKQYPGVYETGYLQRVYAYLNRYFAETNNAPTDVRTQEAFNNLHTSQPDIYSLAREQDPVTRSSSGRGESLVPAFIGFKNSDPLNFPGLRAKLLGHPDIRGIGFRHLSKLPTTDTVTVALAFCPLYKGSLEEGYFDPNPQGEESIIESRIGKKWTVTKHILQILNDQLSRSGQDMAIQATFGDRGAFCTPNKDYDRLLKQHSQIYNEQLAKLCQTLGIRRLQFTNLSDFYDQIPSEFCVPQYVDPKQSETIFSPYDIDMLLVKAGLKAAIPEINEKGRNILAYALRRWGGNFEVWKEHMQIYTQCMSAISKGADIRIGNERVEWILAFPHLDESSDLANMPTINVLV